jgi:hypothetical protein
MSSKIVSGSYVDELDSDSMVKRVVVREDYRIYRCGGEEITLDYVGHGQYSMTTREISI